MFLDLEKYVNQEINSKPNCKKFRQIPFLILKKKNHQKNRNWAWIWKILLIKKWLSSFQAFLSKYITREKSKEKSKSSLDPEKSVKSTFECSFCDGKFVKSSLKKHVKMAHGKNSGHKCEFCELFSAKKCELWDNFSTTKIRILN